jgi:eukaryotic-like serine/threonine-protein kinase
MKFSYACGHKPLEGYTIKRGVGHGGFGEVYFGVSDSGKEVALKCIRQNLDIELRGINQCLNLKHPHLVHLYDLRADKDGVQWLIMEFVQGESLSSILQRFPQGLPHDLLGSWFQQLASAVHYLHESGIVHRDLKPANVFIENGVVKVGDYGLCKFIGGSNHEPHTMNIGTVHYMAPEISQGNYNRQIDVYSAGIVLYEMLRGKVPFDGESAGEILMKHLTARPDYIQIPDSFVPILDRALHKNPKSRHGSMAEMAKEVARLTIPKTQLQPQAARPLGAPAGGVWDAPRRPDLEATLGPAGAAVAPGHGQTGGLSPGDVARKEQLAATQAHNPRPRWVELGSMLLCALVLSMVLSMAWALVFQQGDWRVLAPTCFLALASSWALLIPGKLWTNSVDESWQRRLSLMGLGLGIGLLALWLEGYRLPIPGLVDNADALDPVPRGPAPDVRRHPFFEALYPPNHTLPVLACYLSYFGLMFLVLRWWKDVEEQRPQRFSLQALLATLLWAYGLLFLLPTTRERHIAFATMAMTSVIVQVVSPWRQSAPQRVKRLRLRYA